MKNLCDANACSHMRGRLSSRRVFEANQIYWIPAKRTRRLHARLCPIWTQPERSLRRMPRERVNSEGFRGFKSPPLCHRVWLLRQSPGNSAKWAPLWPVLSAQANQRGTNIGVIRRCASVSLRAGTCWFGFAIASAERCGGTLVADVADIDNEQAALWLEQSVYSRPTTRFWVVQSNGRSTCGVSFRSASSPRSAIASTIFGARNANRMRRAT
jgi:hypothetical protein